MQGLFADRQLKQFGVVWGFPCLNTSVNNLGILSVNVETTRFNATILTNNGVYSKSLPIINVPGTTQYRRNLSVFKADF